MAHHDVADSTQSLLEAVESARERVATARGVLIEAEGALQEAVQRAFEGGVKGPQLAQLLEVTVSRVYQLRRGR